MSTKQTSSQEPLYRDPDWLRDMYVGKEMTTYDIAEVAGVDQKTIVYWMEKFGIDRRSTSENNRVERASYCITKDGPIWQSWNPDDVGGDWCKVSQLLACLEYDSHEVFADDTHVHHRNKRPRDNRLENLELMSASEHKTHHEKIKKKAEYLGDYEEAMATDVQPAGMADW